MYTTFKKILFLLSTAMLPSMLFAGVDEGPRMYWHAPVGTNILQPFFWTASGNTISPTSSLPQDGFDTDVNMAIVSYSRMMDVGGYSVIPTVVVLGGKVSGSYLGDSLPSASGFGDLYFQGTINIFGAPALSEEAFASYKQDTVLSFFVGVTAPTGVYDGNRALNMGENRWNMHVGLPFMQTLGEWIPGEITTFELVPGMWIYGDNDDYFGANFEQDPMYTLEAHITRDLTPEIFVSLDYFIQRVGDTRINGISQNSENTSDSLGATLGYMFNPQTQVQFRYAGTLNPNPDQTEFEADMFQLNINYFW